ncbi:FdrA family protein [Nonomuraea sp. NEAU-A123]|uniref:FdrA family protein n=1 Tax=Nonomuraea sp. NEAU-A123 TaxID=2839649 RepID=UPI001BE3F2B0|nr:FdrA family protein [Nonomuraea sp. NEAU-A123]MBT2227148.1 FdrA family protein [Nonomuraea sp. NEAU-A123]
MTRDAVLLRKGVYHDSVTLMRVSRSLSDLPGMQVAIVAMATELNLGLARDLGFDLPPADPGDLLVALRGDGVDTAAGELDQALARLSASRTQAADQPPLTTRSAAKAPADLVLVSVPGEHAFCEALDAIHAGLPVMIFSDGVPVAQERRLKLLAEERDVLVMGPDCGTAVIAGAGLGFANVLRPGPVGLVAASGTGAQQVTSLLDQAGAGVSHVLGVGGRDLSAEVGGLSTMRALRMLDDDPATELIVLVSKPPDPAVARAVRDVVETLRTPVVSALLGERDLTAAAEEALRALGRPVPAWESWPGWSPTSTYTKLKGIYSGGTLCAEARLIAGSGEFTDYGDDAYTRGRAHPMIDPTLRLEALAQVEPGDVVLMDVVLGHGADPDPAASLASAIAHVTARTAHHAPSHATGHGAATVIVALIGTEGDPQGLHRQAAAFREAGATVFTSNAQAARHARNLL